MLLLVTDNNVSTTDRQLCRSSGGVTGAMRILPWCISWFSDSELVCLVSLQVMSQICFCQVICLKWQKLCLRDLPSAIWLGVAHGLIQVAVNIRLTSCLHCSEDMDLAALRQQILLSNKTASEKAETFLLKSQVNDLSKDEWRELIAGIPEDVEKGIGRLKSAGTQLHLLT